jgi:membrane-bound serine protease (ClpP class)
MDELISSEFYSGLFVAGGMALLFMELFVPSGGILGILAVVACGFGVYGFFHQGHPYLAVSTVAAIILVGFYTLRYGLRRTALEASMGAAEYTSVDESLSHLVGKIGIAHTELRPAGIAIINDRKIDVVSPGSFVADGVEVRVHDVSGNRVVVRELNSGATAPQDETKGTETHG